MKNLIIFFVLIIACSSEVFSQNHLFTWGYNKYGQLGSGSNLNKSKPNQINSDSTWVQISGGDLHSAAINGNGTLWTWGMNYFGQLGDGTIVDQITPVQVGTNNNWVSVSCGVNHTAAIKNDNTLWVWGKVNLNIMDNGKTVNTPEQVGTDTDWAFVNCGSMYVMAIKKDGTLWAWGSNSDCQLGDGTRTDRDEPVQIGTDTDWLSVDGSLYHTLAVKRNGTLWGWGRNDYGQLGNGKTGYSYFPEQIGSDTNWVIAKCGYMHSVALKKDKTIWVSGNNSHGQLGISSLSEIHTLTQVGNDINWASVSAGVYHTVGIKDNGTLWTWGYNEVGQLGDSTFSNRNMPIQVGTDSNWVAIDAGSLHTIALKNFVGINITTTCLISPPNQGEYFEINPILIWEPAIYATGYQIQVSLTKDFTNPFIDEELLSTQKEITGLTNNTQYYWRVKGKYGEQFGDWSDVYLFTTLPAANVEYNNISNSVSPQPVKDEVVITYDFNSKNSEILIELFDLKGTLVSIFNFTSQVQGTNQLRLDVSNLPSGIYNAIIKNKLDTYHAKIIKVD